MSRSLITEDNPQVVAENATVEEIDIDHIAMNIPINHNETENVITSYHWQQGSTHHREGTELASRGLEFPNNLLEPCDHLDDVFQ